jgi:phosphatidylglycerophosphate synthase
MKKEEGADYEYSHSLKSDYSDELINTYVLRPTAGVVVRILYPTSVTPNQVTVAAIIIGICASYFYWIGDSFTTLLAGALVTFKDLLDSADGQLARAKNLFSRRGRFLDSIGDFVVDLLIFTAITLALYRVSGSASTVILGAAGFLGITLRVSYHVFYHVSYLHAHDQYQTNRLIEEIRDEDRRGDPVALRLKQVFVLIYSWQDRLMMRIDEWSKSGRKQPDGTKRQEFNQLWYSDEAGLRISGFLGLGTELAILTVCSLLDNLILYLWINGFVMNGLWLAALLYRRIVLAPSLSRRTAPAIE